MIDGDGDGGDCGDLGGGGIASVDTGNDGFIGPGPSLPNLKRVEINGAPVIEASHEYVVKKSDAED